MFNVFLCLVLLLLSACQTKPGKPIPVVPTPPVTSAMPLKPEALPPTNLTASFKLLDYSALPGWNDDNLSEAWPAFKASCEVLRKKSDWQDVCSIAQNIDEADDAAIRVFFEVFFDPYQIINQDGTDTGLITGYYEPLLKGSRKRGGVYQIPLYKTPSDLLTIDLVSVYPELKGLRLRGRLIGNKVVPYFSRAELSQSDSLEGQEICWVDNSVDAFFLQVQGSGRVLLEDSNEIIRLAYANQNGQLYKSIGRYLVDQGEIRLEQASAQGIKKWIAKHAEREQEVLNANPSYVFFKEEVITDPTQGPKGALGVALSEKRSIAIDPQQLPLGAPIFISTTEPNSAASLNRLVLAQDTGGAIRGAVRADFFWGFGERAGEMAGRMKQRGMMWVLWPKLASNTPSP